MFEKTLIAGDNIFMMWAICIFIATLAILLEQKTKFGNRVGCAAVAIFTTLIVANVGIIPNVSPVYDAINGYVLPLCIPLLLVNCNLKKIIKESGSTMIVYLCSALGIMISTILCGFIFHNGDHVGVAGIAALLTGAHIGGTVNIIALGETFSIDQSYISAVCISAQIYLICYMLVQGFIANSKFFRSKFPHPHIDEFEKNLDGSTNAAELYWKPRGISLLGMALSLTTAIVITAVSNQICTFVNATNAPSLIKQLFGSLYLVMTLLTAICATAFPKYFERLEGAEEMGTFMIGLFFVALGGAGNISTISTVGIVVLCFYLSNGFFSLALPMLLGKKFKWKLEDIIIASNAAVGGPTTAPAFAIGKGWTALIAPGILLGVFGYVIGNYLGVVVYNIVIGM